MIQETTAARAGQTGQVGGNVTDPQVAESNGVAAPALQTGNRIFDVNRVDDVTAPAIDGSSFIGKSTALSGKDRMCMLLREDPERPGHYFSMLSEYTREPNALRLREIHKWPRRIALKLWSAIGPSSERAQMTRWVPRMHAMYLTPSNGGYKASPVTVSNGEILRNLNQVIGGLKLGADGTMKGAEFVHTDADGNKETIQFSGGPSSSTWRDYWDGKYYYSEDPSGDDYDKNKMPNTRFDRTADGSRNARFIDPRFEGDFSVLDPVPGSGFYVLQPKQWESDSQGLKNRLVTFVDIVDWSPFRTTKEALVVDPAKPKNVGFFYELHNRDKLFSWSALKALFSKPYA